MIKVLIVDDQPLIREGLAALLSLRSEVDVVGTATDGQEAYECAKRKQLNMILMDIRMPGVNGVDGTKLIKSHFPEMKVLMLTTFNDSELIFSALEEGASGYLLKDMSTDTIVQAMLTVQSGGIVLPPEATGQMVKEMKRIKHLDSASNEVEVPATFHELTSREVDVLKYLGYGYNNKEIANTLFITEGTVKNHVSNIINKLELRDRTQAAIFAVRYGVVTFP
ncbi:response regulator [Peribacillus sp. NPDC096379]|uniref:response regulator n=1 Tax=Peribacillus sp. NPDC096379 TaxID=3364393 RepID=UPI0037F83C1C